MNSSTDPKRNQPSDTGRNNDPAIRDESAAQPGVNTMSKSSTDDANQHLTETSSDAYREDLKDDGKADPAFDDIDKA